MDRTLASFAPFRGGDRAYHRATTTSPVRRLLTRTAEVVAAVIVGVGAVATVGLASPDRPAAAVTDPPSLQLLPQSSFWVGPGQNLTVRFALPPSLSSPVTARNLGVTVVLYRAIADRSTFDETLHGTASGVQSEAGTVVPLSNLADQDGYTLTVSVTAGGTSSTGGDAAVDLGCDVQPCGGVYPLRLEVQPLSGGTLPGGNPTLLTHLVYVDRAAVSEPLRFAMVVPLALAPQTAGRRGTPSGPSPSAESNLSELAAALAARPTVPLTVAPGPATLVELDDASGSAAPGATGAPPSTRAGRVAARQLAGTIAAAASSARETLSGPYVPVDADALVDNGLATELSRQVVEGRRAVAAIRPSATDDTWVASSPIDQSTVDALGNLGFTRFVVPSDSVATNSCDETTCTQTFAFGSSATRPAGVVSDAGLTAELEDGTGPGAVLAAHQLIADLALVYYEEPNAAVNGVPAARGLVLAVPAGISPNPLFMSTLLAGLGGDPTTGEGPDPLVSAVTLDQFFAQVPEGTLDTQPSQRSPQSVSSTALPARAIRQARARWQSFAGSVSGTGADAVVGDLDSLLLTSESSILGRSTTSVAPAGSPAATDRAQDAAVRGFEAALQHQLSLLALPRGTTIRLASSTAKVPITITNAASYAVSGTLTVSSDKIVFGTTPGCTPIHPTIGGATAVVCQMDLAHTANTVYVEMRSRVSGGFDVSVVLATNDGRLDILAGTLNVRALSSSAVAIALSVGAVAVLLTWWGRTVWRGRRGRRGAHAKGAAGDRV